MKWLVVLLLLVSCSKAERIKYGDLGKGCRVECDLCTNLDILCVEGLEVEGKVKKHDLVIPEHITK